MSEQKCRKVYVPVNLDVDAEGNIRPRLIRWIDGRVYEIDRLKHKCRAASTKVGGCGIRYTVPFPVSWTVKMKKKQKETQDILSYHSQAAGCSDKARAKASGGRQPIEECGRTGL